MQGLRQWRESDSDSFIAAKTKTRSAKGRINMSIEADSGHRDFVQVFEWQNNSEATPLELMLVGFGGGQMEGAQIFPIMLFEIQTDVVAGPAIINPDRLI
jgi:hypothetical protein